MSSGKPMTAADLNARAEVLNGIYARLGDDFLRPVAMAMERAIEKHRDLQPGDSVIGHPDRWHRAASLIAPFDRRELSITCDLHFWERPVVISVDEHRSCCIRFNDGHTLQIHAQWLRRVTYDEVGE